MDIDSLRMFKVVAQYLNITQAALILDVSQPTLSRRIKQLESNFGTMLLHRSGSSIELTPQGAHLLQSANSILEEYDKVADSLAANNDTIRGTVKIGAPHPMLRWMSEDFFPSLAKDNPNIHLDLMTVNPKSMSKMAECDIMIAPFQPNDLSLIARECYHFKRYFCASERYIEQYGEPLTPNELDQHNCITNSSVQKVQKVWEWTSADSNYGSIKLKSFVSIDSIDIAAQWMRSGLGIASIPDNQVEYHRGYGDFKVLFDGGFYQEQIMYVVYRSRNFTPQRNKFVIQAIVDFLRNNEPS